MCVCPKIRAAATVRALLMAALSAGMAVTTLHFQAAPAEFYGKLLTFTEKEHEKNTVSCFGRRCGAGVVR